ncbi:tandem-95 repeat protein [Persicirhabdus sediminis]|uniref:Tandem-95 repeat protein n=2 Tax=Persicirhabdus sediminis TaxID=454144 RepID=A0A8J7SMJ6_9BACT|nr:tandem-95 repeat protein [Persicirhabdus sediminis]
MKKLHLPHPREKYSPLGLAALSSLLCMSSLSATELLQNVGFEEPALSSGGTAMNTSGDWFVIGNSNYTTIQNAGWSSESGNQGAWLKGWITNLDQTLYQDIPAVAGDRYHLALSSAFNANVLANGTQMETSIVWLDASGQEISRQNLDVDALVVDTSWHRYELEGIAPAGCETVRVQVHYTTEPTLVTTSQSSIIVDNVSLTKEDLNQPLSATEMGSGLVGYWPFDGDLNDAGPSQLNGSAVGGVSYTNGPFGQAVKLDDVAEAIDLNAGDISYPWTFSAWVKRSATGEAMEVLFDSANGSVRLKQDGIEEIGISKAVSGDLSLEKAMPSDQWVHLAMVAGEHTTCVYVDGYAYGTPPFASAFRVMDLPLDRIGQLAGTAGVHAELDELAVWNRELNAAEIRHLYLNGLQGETTSRTANVLNGRALGLSGPGINQQSYTTVGEKILEFDLNGVGDSGEEGRVVSIGYRDGWFYSDGRKLANTGGISVYDFSDITNPRRVSQHYDVHRPEHLYSEYLMPDGQDLYINATYNNEDKFIDISQLPAVSHATPQNLVAQRSPDVNAFFDGRYAYYGQYGYPRSHVAAEIWDMKTDTKLVDLDFENQLGFRGCMTVVGNLMLVTASNTGDGVAAYDVSNPANPVLLDLIYGVGNAYEPAVYGDKLVMPGKDAAGNKRTTVVDFSDPSNLTVVGSFVATGLNHYIQFQDNIGYIGRGMYNMDDLSTIATFDVGAEYMVPMGNVVLSVGGKGHAAFYASSTEPDTRGPDVSYCNPVNGATGQSVKSRIAIVIPENLDTSSITPENFIVRPVGGQTLAGYFTYSDKDIITFTPDEDLAVSTTYEIVVSQGGIKDVVGNGLETTFTSSFTTSDSAIDNSNAAPLVTDFNLSTYPVSAGQSVTLSPFAIDSEGEALEYQLVQDGVAGAWQSAADLTTSFSTDGRHQILVNVRDASGNVSSYNYTITVGSVPTGAAPAKSSGLTIDTTTATIWSVNPDNNTVSALLADTNTKVKEVAVGQKPVSVATNSVDEVWVTCKGNDQIDIITTSNNNLSESIKLDYGSAPSGITYHAGNDKFYVALEGSGQLLEIDPASKIVTRQLELSRGARAIAIDGDGNKAYVSQFITEVETAHVWQVDLTNMSLTTTINLAKDTSIDESANGRGILNYLAGLSINPAGDELWVAATKANTDRGEFLEGGSGQPDSQAFQNTIRAVTAVVELSSSSELAGRRFDHDNKAFPAAVEFSPLGDYVFIAMRGNNEVLIYDILDGTMALRKTLLTELSPDALLYDATSGNLFVKNFMSRSVQSFDIQPFLAYQGATNVQLNTITVSNETLSAEVLLGKQVFYNANDERMSRDSYLSCASCHDDGGQDGRTYDFTERGEGIRNNSTLNGKRGTGHGRVHWSGNFDEIQDFEHDIRGPFGGTGFLADSDFNTGSRNQPLGDSKAGHSVELDALAAYVTSLKHEPRSPAREADGYMTASAYLGQRHFADLNCAQCHGGADFTDSASLVRHDIGTIKVSSGQRLSGLLDGIDTPTLKGLADTAPYLHDGSAATLAEVFNATNAPDGSAHAVVRSLSASAQQELLDYIIQLDSAASEAPGTPGANLVSNAQFDVGTDSKNLDEAFDVPSWRRVTVGDANIWLEVATLDGIASRYIESRWQNSYIYQDIPVNAGDIYQLSTDYYNKGDNNNKWEPTLQLEWYDALGGLIGSTIIVDEGDIANETPGIWYTLQGSHQAPASAAFGRVILRVDNNGSSSAQRTLFDNVSMVGNAAPVALDDTGYLVDQEDTITIDVLANDSDADGDTLSLVSVTNGTRGTAVIDNGKVTYTPSAGQSGSDSFTYTLTDGNQNITANVSLTIEISNLPPVANNDSLTLIEGSDAQITLTGSDPDGDNLNYNITGQPASGQLSQQGSLVTYTPNAGFYGTDSFSFTASDAEFTSASATITVTVEQDLTPKLARTTLSSVGNTNWTQVDLGTYYHSAVIIATPIYPDSTTPPVVTRLRNVSGSGFEIQIDRFDGLTDSISLDVSIVAVEAGIYTHAAHGVTMEAARMTSTVTAENNNWLAESVSYNNSYTSPVVLGQVMSNNDDSPSVFWCHGSSRNNTPDANNLNIGKHVGEDSVVSRADETIGYIVIESGSGTINGVAYEAATGADSIRHWSNNGDNPYSYSLSGALSNPSVAALSGAAMDGADGYWPVLFGASPISSSSLNLVADEDMLGNSERKHATEQVNYLVLE